MEYRRKKVRREKLPPGRQLEPPLLCDADVAATDYGGDEVFRWCLDLNRSCVRILTSISKEFGLHITLKTSSRHGVASCHSGNWWSQSGEWESFLNRIGA